MDAWRHGAMFCVEYLKLTWLKCISIIIISWLVQLTDQPMDAWRHGAMLWVSNVRSIWLDLLYNVISFFQHCVVLMICFAWCLLSLSLFLFFSFFSSLFPSPLSDFSDCSLISPWLLAAVAWRGGELNSLTYSPLIAHCGCMAARWAQFGEISSVSLVLFDLICSPFHMINAGPLVVAPASRIYFSKVIHVWQTYILLFTFHLNHLPLHRLSHPPTSSLPPSLFLSRSSPLNFHSQNCECLIIIHQPRSPLTPPPLDIYTYLPHALLRTRYICQRLQTSSL